MTADMTPYELTVNGEPRVVEDALPTESLLYVLRERLGLPGSKNACEQGECGSCSVLVDVVTVEGLVAGPSAVPADPVDPAGPAAPAGELDLLTDVQRAMVEAGGVQC